jgi:DNA helicase II / ATP-dependent DNA helicase PcrA
MASIRQLISQLNQAQAQAVEADQCHVLVSAGAGTGKTRVLTLRYGHLVEHYQVNPRAIMAVTFTNKAAHEMRHRLRDLFPIQNLWVGTFHSLGMRLLRQSKNAQAINRSPDFTVLDTTDQTSILQKILKTKTTKKTYTPRMLASAISQWKHELLLPSEVVGAKVPFYLEVYQEYHHQLQIMNALDFDDLVMLSLRVMRQDPDLVPSLGFQHVLVDEYQDINEMQYQWLQCFSRHACHLFCVGDDDQSIYGWRGASIDKILRFPADFPGAQVVCLEDNYRSTPHILAAASHLIAHNADRYGKVLRTDQTCGEKIQVQGLWDSSEEAAFLASKILDYHRAGHGLKNMAVLVRTSAQTREFEERFSLQHIPYQLVGSTRFYDRLEIRDVVAYLRLVGSSTDNLAFERAVGAPKRGIGPTTLQSLYGHVAQEGGSLEQSARQFVQTKTDGVIARALTDFLDQIDQWRQQSTAMPPHELAEMIIQQSGYAAYWHSQGIQGQTRLENIGELVRAMQGFASLASFLEHVSLLSDLGQEDASDSISLMTLHAAKGLEFDTVFLPGWEEHIFPHIRAIEESGKKGIEEERRLAYVGLTRARKNSHITFCWNRKGHQGFMPASPSRFIQELPSAHISLNLKTRFPGSLANGAGGEKVTHAVFGRGTVQEKSGDIVSVLFERHGLKKVMGRFLNFLS